MARDSVEIFDLETLRASKRATVRRDECGLVLRIDPRTVTAGIREGTIPSIKIGRRILIPRERLLAMLESSSAAAPDREGAA